MGTNNSNSRTESCPGQTGYGNRHRQVCCSSWKKDSVITSTSVSEDSVVNTEEGIQTRTQSDKLVASKDSVVSGTDTLSIKAQKIKPAVRVLPNPYMLRFTAFLKDFRKDYDDALERWEDPYLLITGIKPDPDFFKLAFPATYYEAPVQQAFGIDGWEPTSIYCHKEQEEKKNAKFGQAA